MGLLLRASPLEGVGWSGAGLEREDAWVWVWGLGFHLLN